MKGVKTWWPAVDLAKPGQYVTLHNAKVDMFRGSMRLVVNQRGKLEAAESTEAFKVKVMNVCWAGGSALQSLSFQHYATSSHNLM